MRPPEEITVLPKALIIKAFAMALTLVSMAAFAAGKPKPVIFTDAWRSTGGAWARGAGETRVDAHQQATLTAPLPLKESFEVAVTVRPETDTQAGLILTPAGKHAPTYFLGLDPAHSRALFARKDSAGGSWNLLIIRNAPVKAGVSYRIRLVAHGWRLQGFLHRADVTPPSPEWPFFDVNEASFSGGTLALRAEGPAIFKDLVLDKPAPLPGGPTYTNSGGLIPDIADPDVLKVGKTYYAYGTGGDGIRVYESRDLVHWSGPAGATDGDALSPKDSWGTRWFWAPEVIAIPGGYRMHYTVEQRLAIAESRSPLGPFRQRTKGILGEDVQQIDSHPFTDDDGKQYLYFSRWRDGRGRILVAEMNADGAEMLDDTIKECISQSQPWEHAPVIEAPWVIKHEGTYYLMYSGNGFGDWDYGVGYATAPTPTGPWTKYAYNPVLASNAYVHGAGHHATTQSPDGKETFIVYHSHRDIHNIQPRKLAIDRMRFIANPDGGPDIIEVYGPTLTPQPMPSGSE